MEKNWESYDKPNYKRMMTESVVEEPDWIPDGDGRAVGQQDFAINLSPLHAESGDSYTVAYAVHSKDTGEEIDDGEITVMASSPMEAKNEAMRMLEEGGLDDEEYELHTPHKEAESSHYKQFLKDMNKRVRTGKASAVIIEGMEGGLPKSQMFQVGYEQDGFKPSKIQIIPKQTVTKGIYNTESRFDKLSKEIADEYEEKGKSPEEAERIGDATAAMIGRKKYGKKGMMNMQKKGMKADMVGSPSPTFNEDITGQDGPSAEPTNAVFEAMRTLAPSSRDVESARRDLKNSGYGDVIYDRYMVNRDGSSNKFYYTAVTEKDGKYYPMGAYGRIGYLSKLFNIYGKKENPRASMGSFEQAYRQCRAKENAKIKRNYVDFTLQMAEEFRAETLAEIEGPTAEATTGGLHSPSSFTIGWEDGAGYSSASLPPNEIAWAEEVKGAETKIFGIGLGTLALGALGIFGVKKLMDSKKDDTASGSDTKNAEKGCGCAKTVKKSVSVKESEYSVNQINPVEVEGQNDIHNAESIKLATPYSGPQTAHRQNNRPARNLW